MFHAAALEHRGKKLRLVDGYGAYENRLAFFMCTADLVDDCVVLSSGGRIDNIVLIDSGNGLVCGNDDYIEVVDLSELVLFGEGGK